MNTTHRRWAPGIAFAGIVMAATAACGSDTAVAPAKISEPVQQERTETSATKPCPGTKFISADHWQRTVGDCTARPATTQERRAAESRMDASGRIPDYTP